MTDLKTVREALHLAEKKFFDATGRIDLELSSSITQALAALDRVEALAEVAVVTVQDFEDVIENATAEEVMTLYPNGLRIVKGGE